MRRDVAELKSNEPVLNRLLAYRYLFGAQAVLALAVVLDYSFDFNIKHVIGGWFYLLVLAGELLALLPLFNEWNLFGYRYAILGVGHLLVGIFLIYLTDIFGPYFGVLILLLFATIYWVGLIGLLLGLAFEFLIIAVGAWYQYGALNGNLISLVSLHFLVLTMLGVIFERISLPHRLQANSTEHLLQTVSFERTRLLSLINSMADAVIATNSQGRILVYNGAALDLLNTNANLENHYLGDYVKLRSDKGRLINIVKETKKADTAIKRDDLYFVANDGQKVQLYVDIAPVRSALNYRVGEGFIMLLRDITREKSLDEERSEFISVTSHELRTPIAVAEANISTALLSAFGGSLPENVRQLLEQAHNQIIFLADLVNDLTTLSRAERNDLAVETGTIEPLELLKQLAHDYRDESKSKKLRLIVDVPNPVSAINSSELYVHEILQNFVTNAMKYTLKGQITLSVAPGKSPGSVVFSVKDTGIGIASSDQKKVFGKFYRAEDYRTRKTRGTGLGLYITVKLTEKIHGRIWFKSKLNSGSIFFLEVPSLSRRKRGLAPARNLRALVRGGGR